jgi:hypothetical protein
MVLPQTTSGEATGDILSNFWFWIRAGTLPHPRGRFQHELGGNARSTLAWGEVESTDPHKSEELTVPLVTLDAYLAEHAFVPRCVKIDAEGAEIRILQGATCLLSSEADIVCELHPFAWPRFGNTLAELKDVLAASGRHMRYLGQAAEMAGEAEYGTVALERS